MTFNGPTSGTAVSTNNTTVIVDLDHTNNVSTSNVYTNNVSTSNVYTNNVSTSNVYTNNVINPTLYDRWLLPL